MKKMTGFVAKVMAVLVVATLVLGTNAVKASANDEIMAEQTVAATGAAFEIAPAEENAEVEEITVVEEPAAEEPAVEEPAVEEPVVEELVKDFYLCFSIAKADRVDNSNGTTAESKDIKDYFQIKGVASKEEESRRNPKDNKKIDRYNVLINEAQVQGLMAEVLGTDKLTKVLNETNGSKISSYRAERNESLDGSRNMIETVLTNLGVIDEVNAMTRAFVRNKSNAAVQSFLAAKYPEINFDNDDWFIDWYVMKTQTNGIHVDGVFVTVYDAEPEVVEEIEEVEETVEETVVEEIAPATGAAVEEIEEFEETVVEETAEVEETVEDTANDEIAEVEETVAEETVVEEPARKFAPALPFIPPYEEPEADEEIAPATGSAIEAELTADDENLIDVEATEIPAGAVEEITVDTLATPASTPDEAAEEIEIAPAEVPAGDVLPQTGLPEAALFYEFGAAFVALGATVIGKTLRKKED
ncbi:MAG: hypothetical protein ILP10_07440 [Lachnospiraceae bacterium]|nr:hypothetical protein [Lachnospiraceae bacterium]